MLLFMWMQLLMGCPDLFMFAFVGLLVDSFNVFTEKNSSKCNGQFTDKNGIADISLHVD